MGDFGTSVAVVVGIDTYAGAIPNLRTAVADAKAVASRLATEQGYVVELLVDEAATRAALLGLLEETLPRRLGPGDRVLFYFAGHGIAQDGDDGPEGYLLPVDAVAGAGAQTSFLPMARINAAFRALPCRHRFLMLDCCFAGSFRWAGHRSFAPEVPQLYRQRFRRFLEGTAAQVLVSAAEDQKALDLVDGLALGRRDEAALEGGHSPFAAAVLAGLSGAADLPGPDHQPDGVITATELYLYVRDQVELAAERRGARQTPGLWPLPEHGRGEYLFGVPGQTPRLIEDPRLDAAANPWRGLKAYERTHAPLFFGRDGEIAALQDRLTAAERLLVVLGASGTGKSSLVKAGLLPRLAAGWTVLGPERPGADPMGMVQRLGAGWVAAEGPVLAVVDQFEELFTHNASPGAVSRACHALEALLADGCRVLLTLRSDFEGRAQGTALGHRFAQARYVVPPMDRNGLRAVIEQPAQLRVLYFEPPELVDTLVDEVQALPGGLPLLSFTLAELYVAHVERDAGDRALRQADYDALGGVTGALQSRAEALYAAANPAEQESLRRLMLRAVTVDVDKVARRRVPLAELRYEAFAETRRTQAVVDRMVAARLLVSGANDDGVRYVEPAHDALVRGWHRVYEWLHAGADVLPLQRALRHQAVEWAGRGQPTSMLWHDDARLPQARQQGDALNALELAFVKASRWRRMRRRLKVWAAMLLLGLAGVFVARPVVGWVMQVPLTLMGHVQAHVATACAVTNLKQVELMAELAAGSPMPVQRLLGLARWLHLTLPALNITAPGRALAAGRDGVWAVQLSVEGRPVFITAEGEVRPDAAGFVSVAAGRRLALLARAGGGAEIWDQRSARRLRDLGGPDQPVYGGALAWDDGRALTTEIGGAARVWAVDTGAELPAVGHDGPLNAA
ncbi:MAG: caspase family protein, partial [Myxococcales bacterium]|nr:caspase family protein [Myxococcales bacterium]